MKTALKGNIIYAPRLGELVMAENSWLVADKGTVEGIYSQLPLDQEIEKKDYGDCLIIPGFVDLHLHAPQFANRGLGLDQELLPWLKKYTFPEEAKYADLGYARKAYGKVVKQLWLNGTTRSVVFATLHRPAAELLMNLFSQAGLGAFVGKVNMDRDSSENLMETTETSLQETELFLQRTQNLYDLVKPILTPRFVPSCTPGLMQGLGQLAQKYSIPVQSHLSENTGEIALVKQLHPEFKSYASIYEHFGLFGQTPTVMAHGVHLTMDEIALMSKNGVFLAHAPYSNNNLASGMAPIRQLLDRGIRVGLASDVSGGHEIAIPRIIAQAAQVSKLKWLESGRLSTPLSTQELFYLATKGGGKFFGKVGSFEPGYAMDALIIDDSALADESERTLEERLQRYLYCADDRQIKERYVQGRLLKEPCFE